MSRRQTLANLSPSQLNAGRNGNSGAGTASAATRVAAKDVPKGRKSLGTSLAGAVERPSAAGLGMDRRSSAFGGKSGGPKQDPRPLTDKNYMSDSIRTVITYLSTHNFPAQVAPKTLASPTGKDFATIVQFLFQQFDPTYRIGGKVEDEVPVFFKRLNYPFQISKSALFAVGSPHSWPAVLAALTWLVELLNYTEKVEGSSANTFERENKHEQDFLEYLAAGYSNFMSGNDQRCGVHAPGHTLRGMCMPVCGVARRACTAPCACVSVCMQPATRRHQPAVQGCAARGAAGCRCEQLDEELSGKFEARGREIETRCEKLSAVRVQPGGQRPYADMPPACSESRQHG